MEDITNKFAEIAGFTKDNANLATEKLQNIISILQPGNFALCGGTAVVLYVGKDKRVVSPDIDMLITADQLPLVKKNFNTEPNRFGLTVLDDDNLSVDFLVSLTKLQREAINTAKVMKFIDMKFKVILPEYLMVIKMITGRDKDVKDFALLYKHSVNKEQVISKARKLVARFYPEEIDDFESLILYSEYI